MFTRVTRVPTGDFDWLDSAGVVSQELDELKRAFAQHIEEGAEALGRCRKGREVGKI